MKIEMGESLFYSWLRHVKECQIVQTNWTTSGQWTLLHEDELEEIKSKTDKFFSEKYGYDIYKKTSSLSQLLRQAECDALGVEVQEGSNKIYAIDVAFHEAGLNYGDRVTTIKKIIAKSLRTSMCIYGYLGVKEAEVVFASPKINKGVLEGVMPCIADAQELMDGMGFNFRFRILANKDFRDKVLDPILEVSQGIADTNELFLRSYQMVQMFGTAGMKSQIKAKQIVYDELKIGKVVQLALRPALENTSFPDSEIAGFQDKECSRKTFGISFPLLVREDGTFDKARYYKDPVTVNGVRYMLCSQWAERPENNDRPFLMKWLQEHYTV